MAHECAHQQQGHAQDQTLLELVLIDLEPVGQGQTGAAESGIAGGDGAGDDAQHGQGNTHAAHGLDADVIDGGGLAVGQSGLEAGVQTTGDLIDGAAGGGPDQSDDALADHGAVEYHMALLFGLHAAGHQRRLGGMETGDGTAGHGDEHETPDGRSAGMHVVEVGPQLGNGVSGIGKDTKGDTHSHDDQADAEERIDLADDLVDGDEGGDEVVDQNDPQPELLAGYDAGEAAVLEQGDDQAGGADGEYGAHHHQQNDTEDTHDGLHAVAQIDAADLGDGSTVVSLGQHTGEVVVNAAGEDGSEGDPQEHHRAPQSTLHCAEDGTKARNVQQLHQKQLPLGHNDVVDTVVDADSGSFAVVRTQSVVDDFTVCKVTTDQEYQTN